jgi:hypothetical protein
MAQELRDRAQRRIRIEQQRAIDSSQLTKLDRAIVSSKKLAPSLFTGIRRAVPVLL